MIQYDVLIPAYNAEHTISVLLEELYKLNTHHPQKITIVDDGSTDNTSTLIKSHKVQSITLDKNYGKGYALKTGYQNFLTDSHSDYLLCLDADLQHPVDKISDFLHKAGQGNCDIIIGRRKFGFNYMPLSRIFSNSITSWILTRLTRQNIFDSQCGYRCIHRRVLKSITLNENGFQMESEFIIEAAKQKYQIDFIDIPTIYTKHESNIKHFSDTFKFIELILKAIFIRK